MVFENKRLNSDIEKVEDNLRKNVTSKNPLLMQAVADTVSAGGKRLRPALLILSSYFGKTKQDKLIQLASAIELLHTATLIHDDVLDKSQFRRNRETIYKKYGPDMAIYCGDFLYTKALLMLADIVPVNRLKIAARAVKTICEGEVDQYRDKYVMNLSVPSYLKRISRKTAVLFSASCGLGALCANCSPLVSSTLSKLGFYYGVAFQLIDDARDFSFSDPQWGKPVYNDLSRGILTLPAIYACRTNSDIYKMVEEYWRAGEDAQGKLEGIVTEIRSSGGMEYTGGYIQRYIQKALVQIEKLPQNEARDIFNDLISKLHI
ncbi:MAG TPA: polyprenyl synthetase family protein [Ruminiclostridium sp.]|nr:polyprenyl synthetase family protein [Ruminiclostridium sp.]